MGSGSGNRRVSKEEREKLKEICTQSVIIDDELLRSKRAKWEGALIGKFLGQKINSNYVGRVLSRI